MACAYVPIQGPCIKHSFAKSVYKGEDFWLQSRDLRWTSESQAGGTLDALGVFDGHGGKGAGQYAAKHLMSAVLDGLKERRSKQGTVNAPGELDLDPDLTGGDADAWQLQDAAVEQLPEALSTAFQQVQQAFFATSKQSGTTATLVTIVGWDVIIANVGDSCAYLDTGSEVLQVSGNHRLDDCKGERERVEAAGSNVSQSLLDGKPVGPMRVWPGGLAMSRSIGDHEAGEAVVSEPEVRHLVLPETGGRIIIASDGLWDAINPKTAAHHIRGTPATKAAHDLVQAALKKRGLRDDITVIVVDACPAAEDRMPGPLLSRKSSGASSSNSHNASGDCSDRVHIRKPLEEPFMSARNEEVGQRRMAAARAMLAQSDDLSSLSSSPWSSTISSLSDSSAFNVSSSLEATSNLAALIEERDEDLTSADDTAAGDEPIPDAGELDDDDGWETVAKPGKPSQAQDKLDEAVQNLDLVDDTPVQPQHKFHKPSPAAGRGRGYGRSTLRRGRGDRFGSSHLSEAEPAIYVKQSRARGNANVQPGQNQPGHHGHAPQEGRHGFSEAQPAFYYKYPPAQGNTGVQPGHNQPGHTGHAAHGRQGSRGRGQGSRSLLASRSSSDQAGPVVQTGFRPSSENPRLSEQPSKPPRDAFHERRGMRGRSSNRRYAGNRSSSKQEGQGMHASKLPGETNPVATPFQAAPFQAPPIQFGQFAAGSFNPN